MKPDNLQTTKFNSSSSNNHKLPSLNNKIRMLARKMRSGIAIWSRAMTPVIRVNLTMMGTRRLTISPHNPLANLSTSLRLPSLPRSLSMGQRKIMSALMTRNCQTLATMMMITSRKKSVLLIIKTKQCSNSKLGNSLNRQSLK